MAFIRTFTRIFQELWEGFRMALAALKANKLRSFLTMLGIIIGVGTVIGTISLIQGLNRLFV